ncbi:hypothetical protein AB4059_09240 [Lysobacter sp. 2RAF19]
MLRTTLLLGSLLATTLLASPQAHAALVDIDLVDRDTGQWLPETPFRGDIWVAGKPGHRYGVRLTNTSGERVLVVLSVDGVNAVTGQTARPSQAGYVLEPWQSTEIAGWRKSMDDIAQFVFTDLPDSYAARTGRPRNVGVVGIAVFQEARPVRYEEYDAPSSANGAARDAAAPAQSRAKAAAEASEQPQRLGTGHGAREWSRVERTDFVRATRSPSQVTELRYDDYNTLVAIGVYPRPRPPYWRDTPRAFPNGFVPDPPGGG